MSTTEIFANQFYGSIAKLGNENAPNWVIGRFLCLAVFFFCISVLVSMCYVCNSEFVVKLQCFRNSHVSNQEL